VQASQWARKWADPLHVDMGTVSQAEPGPFFSKLQLGNRNGSHALLAFYIAIYFLFLAKWTAF
jgi:hypothetical protein